MLLICFSLNQHPPTPRPIRHWVALAGPLLGCPCTRDCCHHQPLKFHDPLVMASDANRSINPNWSHTQMHTITHLPASLARSLLALDRRRLGSARIGGASAHHSRAWSPQLQRSRSRVGPNPAQPLCGPILDAETLSRANFLLLLSCILGGIEICTSIWPKYPPSRPKEALRGGGRAPCSGTRRRARATESDRSELMRSSVLPAARLLSCPFLERAHGPFPPEAPSSCSTSFLPIFVAPWLVRLCGCRRP